MKNGKKKLVNRKLSHLAMMIRYLRKKKGFTQQELATRAGITRNYIALLERDMRTVLPSTLKKIADSLEVPECHLSILTIPVKGKDLVSELTRSAQLAVIAVIKLPDSMGHKP